MITLNVALMHCRRRSVWSLATVCARMVVRVRVLAVAVCTQVYVDACECETMCVFAFMGALLNSSVYALFCARTPAMIVSIACVSAQQCGQWMVG